MAKGVSLLESVLFTWLRRLHRLQRRLQHHYSSSLHPLPPFVVYISAYWVKGSSLLNCALFTKASAIASPAEIVHNCTNLVPCPFIFSRLHKWRGWYDRVGSKSIVAPLGFGNGSFLPFPAESLSPITFTPQQVIFLLST